MTLFPVDPPGDPPTLSSPRSTAVESASIWPFDKLMHNETSFYHPVERRRVQLLRDYEHQVVIREMLRSHTLAEVL